MTFDAFCYNHPNTCPPRYPLSILVRQPARVGALALGVEGGEVRLPGALLPVGEVRAVAVVVLRHLGRTCHGLAFN